MKKRIISLALVVVMLLTTFLPGVGTLSVEAASITGGQEYVVVTSPWAYYKGSMDNTQTYTDKSYEYATIVSGSNDAYIGALMKDADLSIYKEFRFAMKTNGNYWYEIGLASENNFTKIQKADTTWAEIKFVDEGNDCFQLYINDSWANWQLPIETNLSDLQMRFSSDTNGILYMTEVRGTVREGATLPLDIVADSFNSKTGTKVYTEKPNIASAKSTEVTTSWAAASGLTALDLSSFDKVLFYARKAGSDALTGWFESTLLGTFVIEYNWTEFKLIKNIDGTWNVYTGGVLKASNQSLSNLSEITVNYGDNHYYFSEVLGEYSEGVEKPLFGEYMVVTSPWAYYKGSMDNTQTYTDKSYEYATIVSGSNDAYIGALMKDADLSIYKEFRFAMKTNGNYWYEIGLASENNFTKIQKADTTWVEIKFVDEGNDYFQLYINDSWANWQLPIETNLSDLQMKFSSDTNGILYMTEVRGTVREGVTLPLEIVTDNFNTKTGTDSTEKPNIAATKSTQVTTTWESADNAGGLTSIDLSTYDKILFYARKTSSSYNTDAWLESDLLGGFVVENNWTEFKLTKNTDGTWNIYVGGIVKQSNLSLKNLSEITARYGDDTYYFSEVFGYAAPVSEEDADITANAVGLIRMKKAEAAYKMDHNNYHEKYDLLMNGVINWQDLKWLRQDILEISHEYVVATSPWAYYKGSIDKSQTYTDGGYEYATIINGSNDAYTGAMMKDADLSIYSEFRFAVKTNGNYYYEIGKVADGNFSMVSGNETTWTEFTFEYENDGEGTEGFRVKKNGEWTANLLPADMNLSDLQMKFSSDTNGILYMTELRGTVKEDVRLPLEVVTDSFNAKTGTVVEKEYAIIDATKSTMATTVWSSTQDALTSVDLSLYDKILFYARKTSSSYNTDAWIESDLLGVFATENNWTEFKLTKNTDGTWNIYVGGIVKQSSLSLTNLSEITAKYGSDSYYFSEIFGISTANPIVLLDDSQQALYSVAYSGSSEEFAAEEFTTYMNTATGVTYAAEEVSEVPENDAKKLVIGIDLASKAGMSTSELTTDNGYVIKRKGDNVYVYGKTTQGTLNGVYALLKDAVGLEIYTDDCAIDTYESGAITLKDTNVAFNPDIDYLYDVNGETRADEAYRKKLGYVLDYAHFGGYAHAEANFMEAKGYTGTNGHMTLDDATAKEVAQYMYDTYIVDTYWLDNFMFGLKDDMYWHDSTTAGAARTSQYVQFMNKVATELQALMDTSGNTKRSINLILVAYNNTIMAPTDGTTLQSTESIQLQVIYAPVRANWYKPLTDDINASVPAVDANNTQLFTFDAEQEFRNWKALAGEGNVYVWYYHTFFDSYLTPLDSFNCMRENYALAAELGVVGIYDNVQYDNEVATDWNRLKVYIRNELAKNPTMTETQYEQLISNFMDAYFGSAADDMKEALTAERSLMATVYANVKEDAKAFSLNYGCEHAAVMVNKAYGQYGYWGITRGTLGLSYSNVLLRDNVYASMMNAYNAIQEDTTLTEEEKTLYSNRVKLEMIPMRFILLRLSYMEGETSIKYDFRATLTDGSTKDTWAQLLADCQALGITHYSEGKTITEERLKNYAAE